MQLPTIDQVIGNTPLVRLRHLDAGLVWPVWIKCEYLNPGGSIKDRLALAIINQAEQAGEIRPGDTLIEATAGNTGMGLVLVGVSRGYKVVCVMPEKVSQEKRRALSILGAEVIITPNVPMDNPENFRNVAAHLAKKNRWFLTQQFSHPANPLIHYQTTGQEIWQQSCGKLACFVTGAGTGGSISGIARYLKEKNPEIRIVLADPAGSQLGSFVRNGEYSGDAPYKVEGIGASRAPDNLDLAVIDTAETISDQESFAITRQLIRKEGLWVGGSSGTIVAAALRCATRLETGGPVVALVTDSWDRYFSCDWLEAN